MMTGLVKATQLAQRHSPTGDKALVIVSHAGKFISYEGDTESITFEVDAGNCWHATSGPLEYEHTLTVRFSGDVIVREVPNA